MSQTYYEPQDEFEEITIDGDGVEILSLDEVEKIQKEDMDGHTRHTYDENDPDNADDEDNYWNQDYYEKWE